MKKLMIVLLVLCVGCGIQKKNEPPYPNEKNEPLYPSDWQDNGIFKSYYDKSYQTLETMSLEEKIGQILLVRLPSEDVIKTISEYHFGGIILFAKDFENKTKEEVQTELKEYQQASNIPMLIATDEEGGSVIRISKNSNLYPEPFLSPREIYETSGMDGIIRDTKEKITLFKELGLNLNLSPVVDLSDDPNDFIYKRSFSGDVNKTSEYTQKVVSLYQKEKIGSALKHFPGYGDNKDTHTGIAIDNRNYNQFLNYDFLPFKAGIEVGAPSILVSHNIVSAIDNINPASLSINIHRILRNELKFTGVIMTDDLSMGAISSIESSVIKAFQAGNDILIVTNYQEAYSSLLNAIKTEEISIDDLNHAVFRILSWKQQLQLM